MVDGVVDGCFGEPLRAQLVPLAISHAKIHATHPQELVVATDVLRKFIDYLPGNDVRRRQNPPR